MFYNYFYLLIYPIIFLVLIVGLVAFFVRRRMKKMKISGDKEWYLRLSLGREDSASQLYLLLSFFFLGVTLFAFNKDLGGPLAWRTIILIVSLLGLVGAYYFKLIYTLLFSLMGVMFWWGAQAGKWIEGKNIQHEAVFAGVSMLAILLYSIGRVHEKEMKFKRFALVFSAIGIMVVSGTLFFLSTMSGLKSLEDLTKGGSLLGSWELTISIVLLIIAAIGAVIYAAKNKLVSFQELAGVILLICLFGILSIIPEQYIFERTSYYYSYSSNLNETGKMFAAVFNIIAFFELLGLIFLGYVRRETWLINLGALFMGLFIIVKYFDWFFKFLDKSVFFIGAGILLFVVGWSMERARKYMVSNM